MLRTWKQFIVVSNAQEERQVVADVTPLWVHQDVPGGAAEATETVAECSVRVEDRSGLSPCSHTVAA